VRLINKPWDTNPSPELSRRLTTSTTKFPSKGPQLDGPASGIPCTRCDSKLDFPLRLKLSRALREIV
jgi:hypothetical protein